MSARDRYRPWFRPEPLFRYWMETGGTWAVYVAREFGPAALGLPDLFPGAPVPGPEIRPLRMPQDRRSPTRTGHPSSPPNRSVRPRLPIPEPDPEPVDVSGKLSASGAYRSRVDLRVLVCGGREFSDARFLGELLDAIRPGIIAHGAARGADRLAGEWAKARGVPARAYPAGWAEYGHAAGPIRNRAMFEDFAPDLVVAFPGGRGTADMVRVAERAGVAVVKVAAIRPALDEALRRTRPARPSGFCSAHRDGEDKACPTCYPRRH